MFQPRFASLVESGSKTTTIRPKPKRSIHAGDRLDLRTWTGLPYRSRQRRLREVRCDRVSSIVIHENGQIEIDGARLNADAVTRLAQRDGYATAAEMLEWFIHTHGLPFRGILLEWST